MINSGDMDQNPSLSQLHLTPGFPQLIIEMILELITEISLTQSGGNEHIDAEDKWKNVEMLDVVVNCGQI